MEDDRLIQAVQARSAIYDKWNKNHHNRNFIAAAWESIAIEVGSDAVSCRNRWGTIRDYFVRKHRQATSYSDAPKKKIKWHLYERLSFLVPIYCQKEMPSSSITAGPDFGDVNGEAVSAVEDAAVEDLALASMVDAEGAQCDGGQSPAASMSSEDFLENTSVTFKMPTTRRKRKKGDDNSLPMPCPQPDRTSDLDKSLELVKVLKESECVDENELFFRSLLPSLSRLDHIQTMEFRLEVQSLLLKYLKKASRQSEQFVQAQACTNISGHNGTLLYQNFEGIKDEENSDSS